MPALFRSTRGVLYRTWLYSKYTVFLCNTRLAGPARVGRTALSEWHFKRHTGKVRMVTRGTQHAGHNEGLQGRNPGEGEGHCCQRVYPVLLGHQLQTGCPWYKTDSRSAGSTLYPDYGISRFAPTPLESGSHVRRRTFRLVDSRQATILTTGNIQSSYGQSRRMASKGGRSKTL